MTAPTLRMNDGRSIPQLGLGTWPLKGEEAARAVVAAIELGYRHIDTAYRYDNEQAVGRGIRDSGIRREDLFVTTKLDGEFQGDDRAIQGLGESLRRLELEYVDLLLIHWPLPQRDQYISTWKTFERLVADGKTRSIGVSNFKPAHIERLLTEAAIRPTVNQIQMNPRITRPEQLAFDRTQDIVTVAWGPLGPGTDLLSDPTLVSIGKKYDKTPGQVVLRWHIERGVVAIPKSANPERMAQNIDIFDFSLGDDEVEAITALGTQAGVDSDTSGH